ncbi:MAG: SUMF1/EgtB/PvdO family nonheme iron enzyme [Nitrospirales bacterium]
MRLGKWISLILSFGLFSVVGLAAASHAQEERGLRVSPASMEERLPITGQYWALIIGINEYQHAPNLHSAVKDATAVRDVLKARYGFEKERIRTLLNTKATRSNIEQALFEMGRQAGKDDSVFIYYAGHGQYDTSGRLGWWVPSEANPKNPGTFITNVTILDYVKGMQARHVYLVADSCFSGTLFGTRALPPITDRWFSKLYETPSRWGLTSGANEPVADQGKDGHSPFAYFFLKILKDNTMPYLVPSRIHDRLAPLVANNAQQTPRSEPLKGAGDEGGQFVFRLVDFPERIPFQSANTPQVDLGPYEALAQQAEYRKKLERAWKAVQAFVSAPGAGFSNEKKLSALKKFQKDFSKENPYQDQVSQYLKKLEKKDSVRQIEKKVEKEVVKQNDASMVLIPAGKFTMGGGNGDKEAQHDERPSHEVYLDAYYIDQYEVTTARYHTFMQATRHGKPRYWEQVRLSRDGQKPVIGVSWNDAQAYCTWGGKRLPTEAEWEKAARGTDHRTYPWGKSLPNLDRANFGQKWDSQALYADKLKAVGSYEKGKSPYGVYDMAGNVWEWVNDWYTNDYYSKSSEKNPKGPSTGDHNILRGGSWSNKARNLRSADRFRVNPTNLYGHAGIRCAKNAEMQ